MKAFLSSAVRSGLSGGACRPWAVRLAHAVFVRVVFVRAVFLGGLFLGGLALPASPVAAADPAPPDSGSVARLACNEFPPHKMEHPADGRSGFDIDIITAALGARGLRPDIVFYPWQRALQMAENGRVDGLCSCSFLPERAATLLFSDSIGTVGIGLFSRVYGAAEPPTLTTLAGHTVGVVRGYSLTDDLKGSGATVVDVSSDETGLKMLEQGRLDAYYGFRDTVRYLMRGDRSALTYSEVRSSPYFICISRARPDAQKLLDEINQGLATLQRTGGLDRFRGPYR